MTMPKKTFPLLVLLSLCAMPLSDAYAEQPRDWMIGAATEGGKLNVDMVFPGLQVGYEHTIPIYGGANSLTLRGSALMTSAFSDVRTDADLRIVVVTLGASVGYRDNWRSCTFLTGQPHDRAAMRTCDNTGTFHGDPFDHGKEDYGYVEGRVGLALPFNDYLVYSSTTTALFDDREPRSVDRRNAVVRDADMLFRSDHFLLAHHPSFGGFGPLFQVLNYELGPARTTQLNYGFMFVGSPGFARDSDLILLQMLFHFGDDLGGDDNRDNWGLPNIYSGNSTLTTDTKVPLAFLLAYRMVFNL